MKALPTLYKRAADGSTQVWTIKAVKDQDALAAIVTRYGKKGGVLQEAVVAVRKGKNSGKSNATTPLRQAQLEAAAKWQKQKDKGYVETLESAKLDEAVAKRPMLAHDYKKHQKKIKWPAYAQRKFDGMRCMAHREADGVRLMSRGGKPILTVPHVADELAGLMKVGEIWDGELYVHGWPFQRLISAVKKASVDTPAVEYHVYDVVTPETFEERFWSFRDLLEDKQDVRYVRCVETCPVAGHEDVQRLHDKWVAEGYEGAIVRANGCPYREGARSDKLLKFKQFFENEYVIVAVSEGKGKMEGSAVFECETEEGARFLCLPEGPMSLKQEYWARRDELVGKKLTVRYFEMTSSLPPVPRFPIGKCVRDDYESEKSV